MSLFKIYRSSNIALGIFYFSFVLLIFFYPVTFEFLFFKGGDRTMRLRFWEEAICYQAVNNTNSRLFSFAYSDVGFWILNFWAFFELQKSSSLCDISLIYFETVNYKKSEICSNLRRKKGMHCIFVSFAAIVLILSILFYVTFHVPDCDVAEGLNSGLSSSLTNDLQQ